MPDRAGGNRGLLFSGGSVLQMSQPKRCGVCGWPLAESLAEGCTEQSCSMRPAPRVRWDSTPATARDPRVDPKAGDVVRGVAAQPTFHVGKFAILTVQAVVGNLVATTSDAAACSEIRWQTKQSWCETNAWIGSWEVLFVAPEACK